MCHLCETMKVIERIDRQIKNIEAGGSISPGAVADVLRASKAELFRYHAASIAFEGIVKGIAITEIITMPSLADGGNGGLH